MHKRIFNFFRDNQVITTLQSGFVPGDSTVNQLVDIYNTFCKALDEGKEMRAIFCDISKAFDRVWHKGLLFKLESVGIGDSLFISLLIILTIESKGLFYLVPLPAGRLLMQVFLRDIYSALSSFLSILMI